MYNELNKIEKMTDPSGVTYYQTVYEYDLAGRVTKFKEGCDQYVSTFERMTKYEYDNLDQVEYTYYYLAGNDYSPTKTIAYTYDRNGNTKSYSGPIFSYDENLIMTAQYTYNDASQVINLEVTCPEIRIITILRLNRGGVYFLKQLCNQVINMMQLGGFGS